MVKDTWSRAGVFSTTDSLTLDVETEPYVITVCRGQTDRRKIRALKSGHIPHLKTDAQVKNGRWKHLSQDMSQDDKEGLVKCDCCCGGVQDMEHILTVCGMTEDAVEEQRGGAPEFSGEMHMIGWVLSGFSAGSQKSEHISKS